MPGTLRINKFPQMGGAGSTYHKLSEAEIVSDDRNDHLIVPSLPVLYVPPAKYTDRTSVLTPLFLPALAALAVLGIEWTTLGFIENAPVIVRLATFIIAAFVLAVLQSREWLKFKGRYLFAGLLAGFVLLYLAICAYAFFYLQEPSSPSAAVTDLQTKLAAALRERDIAISQRDAARRDRGDTSPSQPIPPIPQSLKTDEIDARLDAWKAVEAQLNDIDRLLSEGDDTLKIWESDNQPALRDASIKFVNDSGAQRNRLRALLTTYPEFSDLSVIDPASLDKLATLANNLYSALIQLPLDMTKDDYVNATEPYIRPVKREIKSLKDWSKATRKVAESSVLELTTRQQSIK
jgi:hypothetical protein